MDIIAVNGKNYFVVKLLSKGTSGYSYLVIRDNKKYVLKQIHHELYGYYKSGNKIELEIEAYNKLSDLGIIMPKMLEVDYENKRILKEYIDGKTVFEMVLSDNLPNICVEQMKNACELLYSSNINIDYFPTNFILQNDILYYIDYEFNEYMDEWNFENWGIKYWSKTPEFIDYIRSKYN